MSKKNITIHTPINGFNFNSLTLNCHIIKPIKIENK